MQMLTGAVVRSVGVSSLDMVGTTRATIRFGTFEVDLRAGELRKRGVKIKLQKQPFDLLRMLLEHPGEVVSREELQQRIWPADTFVDFDQGLSSAIKRLREALSDSAENPRFIETIPRRGYRFIAGLGGTARRIESLAVLPLENLSRDPEQEYFADGLTEALITSLAKISALRVVSRTSAMQYKGVHKSLREIAMDLGVDGIVEGTVMRSGERVRISAQLVNAPMDTHLWAESYDRDLRDILALQSEVARAIAREIQIKLTPQEQAQLARVHPVDPEAYEAYLKGRYYWNKRSAQGVKKGAEYFQKAIDKDSTYAAAYAGLADSACVDGFWSFAAPEEGFGKARATARKALEIDETAEARASLGWATLQFDWDFLASEKEFQRAIELNPRYATAHQWYGHCLGCMGRFDEAFVELKHAIHLEPLSLIINTSYAGISWLGRQWDQAIEQSQKTLELDPNFVAGRWALARSYDGKGMLDTAIAYAQEAIKLSSDVLFFVVDLSHAYATAGRRDDAIRVLSQLLETSKHRYVDSCFVAQLYAGLNDIEQAFHWLEKAFSEHSAWIAYMRMDPWFDNLRADPRFQDLLRRIKPQQ